MLSNSMYCNGALAEGDIRGQGMAIDWSASKTNMPVPAVGDGPTLNDDGDLDDGPAELQNYPVLTPSPGGVTGILASRPNTLYRIQVFMDRAASKACEPVFGITARTSKESSGGFHQVQGDTMIGEVEVRSDSQGTAWFSMPVPAGSVAAATATQLDDNRWPLWTSELSPAVEVRSMPALEPGTINQSVKAWPRPERSAARSTHGFATVACYRPRGSGSPDFGFRRRA